MRRSPAVRGSWAVAALTALAVATAASPAQAKPDAIDEHAARTLVAQLGDRAAGFYLDPASKRFVVPVTSATAAAKVRHAGGVARIVKRGHLELEAVKAALSAARIPRVSWSTDVVANQIKVGVYPTATESDRRRLNELVGRFGEAVRITQLTWTPTFKAAIYGGYGMWARMVYPYDDVVVKCSVGFNVRNSSGTLYFLSAGHCITGVPGGTPTQPNWFYNPTLTTPLGSRSQWRFNDGWNDFAVIRYTNTGISHPGQVSLYNGSFQDITWAGEPYVNEPVRKSGATTRMTTGKVTDDDWTGEIDGVYLQNMILTNVCVDHGDSGGALFDGTRALGTLSAGDDEAGECWSLFQRVLPVLNLYGLSVY